MAKRGKGCGVDYLTLAQEASPNWFESLLNDSLQVHPYKDSYDTKRRTDTQLGLALNPQLTEDFANKVFKATRSPRVKSSLRERFPKVS